MSISIKGHKAYLDGRTVAYRETPNKSGTIVPEGIILHDTAGGLDAEGSISWLCDRDAKASAHVVIGRDGVITQLAPFTARAWHAGKSSYNGRSDVNGFAVGIEIVNPGLLQRASGGDYLNDLGVRVPGSMDVHYASTKEHGAGYWLTYADAQVAAVTDLCRALVAAYPTIKWISTHWYISPGRKIDTNPLFPLEQVRAAVFGGTSSTTSSSTQAPVDAPAMVGTKLAIETLKDVQAALIALGYELGKAGADGVNGRYTKAAVAGFQTTQGLTVDGVAGPATKRALAAALEARASKATAPVAAVGLLGQIEPGDGRVAPAADDIAAFVRVDVDADERETVKGVQQRLRSLGYLETGDVDGEAGARTRAGILAFRADNGLVLDPAIDADFLAMLAIAPPRMVGPTRANASVAEVAAKVPSVQAAQAASKWAGALTALTLVPAAVIGISEHVAAAKAVLAPLQDYAGALPAWGWPLLVALVAWKLWGVSAKAAEAGAQDYRDARTM